MPEMQNRKQDDAYRFLMAAVINRAIDDLREHASLRPTGKDRDRAMAFIMGKDCAAYCLELGIDHAAVKEQAAALYRRIVEKERPRRRRGKRLQKPRTFSDTAKGHRTR
jgi:transcription initiation factor TFIIIB Brf1 subunit/transcription initiation factor TFIIB